MAWRIGDRIVRGELNNTSRNTVHGWLDFGGDCGIRLELAGNFAGELAGMLVRFETAKPAEQESAADDDSLDALEFQQIGVVGSMILQIARVPQCSAEEFRRLSKQRKSIPTEEKPCLYLEWFSQNGRVVAEIVDPDVTWSSADDSSVAVTPEPLPEPQADDNGPGITGYSCNEEGHIEELPLSGDDDLAEELAEENDPYELFAPDLEQQLKESTAGPDSDSLGEPEAPRRRSWDEVIPGIDAETKKLYEQWDEVVDGDKDEPLATLFDPPLSLKHPHQIAGEAEAATLLGVLLARLALHGVALDMCEHYTALDAYRLLLEEILPEANIHPQLLGTGFIQHYSTWEYCPKCEAEFEAEYEQRHKNDDAE